MGMKLEKYSITFKELMEHLNSCDPDTEIIFGSGDLEFYRVKTRGNHLVQIEFNQIYTITKD
jgi:hypothetical protein